MQTSSQQDVVKAVNGFPASSRALRRIVLEGLDWVIRPLVPPWRRWWLIELLLPQRPNRLSGRAELNQFEP